MDDGEAAEVDLRTVHTYDTHRMYRASTATARRFWPGDAQITLGVEGTVNGEPVRFGSLARA